MHHHDGSQHEGPFEEGPGRPDGPGPRGGGRRGRGPRRFGPGGPGGFGPGGFGGFGGFGPGGPGGPGGFGPGGPGGPGGFGPGGFGPGGFGPGGFGPGGFGAHLGRGRRRRGNLRGAVLALLAEEPRHGYGVMVALAERSGGVHRPSPGSVYPVLAQLEDEGLIEPVAGEGRRVFRLTEEGRRYVEENREVIDQAQGEAPTSGVRNLLGSVSAVAAAVRQVAAVGDAAQVDRAVVLLDDLRRALYRLLAEGPDDAPEATQEPGAGE